MTADTDPAMGATASGRKITIQTHKASREIHICRVRMALLATAAAVGIGWTLTATAGFIVSTLSPEGNRSELSLVEAAYQDRIETLTDALEATRTRAEAAEAQLGTALERLVGQQMALQKSSETERELHAGINAMREKLTAALAERDSSEARASELSTTLANLEKELGSDSATAEEKGVVLAAVSQALRTAVRDRDAQREEIARMESRIAAMELKAKINSDRQQRLVASLQDAVQTSFGPLEKMFEKSGLDVETLVSSVRRDYAGYGGPDGGVPVTLASLAEPEVEPQLTALMDDMDRMNMMRIAAAEVPFTMPVHAAYRFTSSFGYRSDPMNRSRKMHEGVDMAGARGTAIEATADGVVTFAGRMSGYGNAVKIRHGFGFETLYGHMSKIRVKKGQRIARGDQIGDMGNTGRSTGTHLHYEVRLRGKPVNPMTYIRAASDVF